ncbi:MAG: hypothetical protein ACD_79C00643G0007 [uncultured bacterium]|nr:MAG: hypothetical protein ACD_79C00643G0007 [uncultured bacterium]
MQISEKNFIEFNEQMSRKFGPDKYHQTRISAIRFAEKIKSAKISNFLKNTGGEYLLDIGCGSCEFSKKLDFNTKIGLDLSEYILSYSKKIHDDYIHSWKKLLNKISLNKYFVTEYYFDSSNNDNAINHWHLHNFNLKNIHNLIQDYFEISKISYIPFKLMPFQYLLFLKPKK